MSGLYIHVPFCVSKCHYCDFYSVTGAHQFLDAYVDALLIEARSFGGMSFKTIYIGGGTPSLLGSERVERLMTGLGRIFDIGDLVEGTIEVNPESATSGILETARAFGLNRVSVGVQSLSDPELRRSGRVHAAEQAIEALCRAREAGFSNISADLIIGLPSQVWMSLKASLTTVTRLGVGHVSAYCLSLEPGTCLTNDPLQDLPSDDDQADLFDETRAFLLGMGFVHYEISNFARPGFECWHNLNYWRGGEYIGLGPAAASHVGGMRFKNCSDLQAYIADPTGQVEEFEELGKESKAAEEAMLRLRLLSEGVVSRHLTDRYGEDNAHRVIKTLDNLADQCLVTREDSVYRLVPGRVLTSNKIFGALLG